MTKALVIWTAWNQVKLFHNDITRRTTIPGRFWQNRKSKPVAAGDWVMVSEEDGKLLIKEILPRRNEFVRRAPGPRPNPLTAAANLDLVIVVASASQPKTPFGLVDRMMVAASIGGCKYTLLVNKIDLIDQAEIEIWKRTYAAAVGEVMFTDAISGRGTERLRDLLRDRTTLLAGSSGVGKSTLANKIDPSLDLRTGRVSDVTGKGKHVTSVTQLYSIPSGGWLADSPGLRECAPWGLTAENLGGAFPEIAPLSAGCKFRDCRHHTEIGCQILPIVGTDMLPDSRYRNYIKLLTELKD